MTKKTVPCCCLLRSLCTYCQDIKIFFIQLTVYTKGMRMRKNYRPKGESFDMRRQFAYIKHFQKKRRGDESHMAYDFMYEDIHRR